MKPVALLMLCITLACVKVPAEVVVASQAVGEGLGQAEQMTLTWIDATYREAKNRMDTQLKRDWYPSYQARLLASLTPDETALLAKSLQSPDHHQPLQQWQEALMDQYLERQQRLHQELDHARQVAKDGVARWYNDLGELQNAVTGYLESGREVEVGRQQLLEGLDALRGRDAELDRALDITRDLSDLLRNPQSDNLAQNLERLLAKPILENRQEGGTHEP